MADTADIIALATHLLPSLEDATSFHSDVWPTAESMHNLLTLVLEFLKIRACVSVPLDPHLEGELHEILSGISAPLAALKKLAAAPGRRAATGCCGRPVRRARRAAADLRRLETRLCAKLNAVKMDLLSHNDGMMALLAGLYYSRQETPQLFWHRMFRDRQWVSTDRFADMLRTATSATPDVAAHISAMLSDRGCVHAAAFFASFSAGAKFDISKWMQTAHMQTDAPTVCIPAHVGCITEMAVIGDLLVTSSHDCTLKVFEKLDSLVVKSVMIGHEKEVTDFGVMPGGDTVASASRDGTLRVWSVESGEQLNLIKLKEEPYRIRAVDADVVVYLTRGSAYPIVMYDIAAARIVRRSRCAHGDMWAIEVQPERSTMCVSAFDHVYIMSLHSQRAARKISNNSNTYIRNMRVLEDDRLVCELDTGVSIFDAASGAWSAVDIVPQRTSLFRIPRIRVHNRAAYVLWIYGAQHRTSHLTLVDLDARGKVGEHDLSRLSQGGERVNFQVPPPFVYFATNKGNIYWHTLGGDGGGGSGEDSWEGHTLNDQMAMGHNFTNVCIATCDTGVVVCNNRELRFWNVATDTVLERSSTARRSTACTTTRSLSSWTRTRCTSTTPAFR